MLFVLGLPFFVVFIILAMIFSSGASDENEQKASCEEAYYNRKPYKNKEHSRSQDSYSQKQHDLEEISYDPYDDREYDNYYMDTYSDAVEGCEEAIEEMREEFGDDWEGEY